jgi:hypothetical protein
VGTHSNINDHRNDKEYYCTHDKEQRQAGTVSLYRSSFRRAMGWRTCRPLAEGERCSGLGKHLSIFTRSLLRRLGRPL